MVEAIAPIEQALGKPAVTSVQAALWAGVRRLAPKLGPLPSTPALGKLFATL
jgi:maleate cis-trans isomerase